MLYATVVSRLLLYRGGPTELNVTSVPKLIWTCSNFGLGKKLVQVLEINLVRYTV